MALSFNKRAAFITIIFLLVGGLQEVLFRVIFPRPEILNFNRTPFSSLVPQQEHPRYLRNASYRWASAPDGYEVVHELNLYGFRDRQWRVHSKPDTRRIAVIGDSMVEGFMAESHETIPRGMETAAANRGHRVEVMNLGIGGAEFRQHFQVIRDMVPIFNPQDVVLIVYANDLSALEPYDPRWLEPGDPPIATAWYKPRVLDVLQQVLRGEHPPRAWMRPPFNFAAAVPDARNPWSWPSWNETYSGSVSSRIRGMMESGEFNSWAVDVNTKLKSYLPRNIEPQLHLAALSRFAKDHQFRIWIVYLPANDQVSDAYLAFQSEFDRQVSPDSLTGPTYQRHAGRLAEAAATVQVPFYDLTPDMAAEEESGVRLYWNYDEHLRGSSYLLVGHWIYRWMEPIDSL